MTTTYSTDGDVEQILGQLKNKLPGFVDLDMSRQMAYAEIVDRLALTYPNGIPAFSGVGGEAVRWCEAKLAAADILDAIRVNIDTIGDAPDRLRKAVDRALEGGIVGYPPGSTIVDDEEGTPTVVVRSPLVSSFTPVSAFPDPYANVRGDGGDYL